MGLAAGQTGLELAGNLAAQGPKSRFSRPNRADFTPESADFGESAGQPCRAAVCCLNLRVTNRTVQLLAPANLDAPRCPGASRYSGERQRWF